MTAHLPIDDRSPEDITVAFNGDPGHAIEIEAGSLGTWTFTYIAGDRGIRRGGRISFWNDQTNIPCAYRPQTDDPHGWDYVTVETTADADVEITHLAPQYKDNRFCEVQVARGELVRGDTITLRAGDARAGGHLTAAPAYTVERIHYYVATDPDGDGYFGYLPYVGVATIVPGRTAKLTATAPSVVRVGEAFALHVRAEDANSNPGARLTAELVVELDGDELARGDLTPEHGGIIEIPNIALAEAGVHRLAVRTVDGAFRTTSNPIRCEAEPTQRIYWGDMHAHADYADATGSLDWNHDFARNKARLDFFGQTEHIYCTPGNATGAFTRPPVLDIRKLWNDCQRTVRRWHQPGRFVTFLGYERTPWERRRAAGDLTVWFMDDDADLVIEETIAETIEAVKAAHGRIFIGTHAAQRPDWNHYPDDVETVMPTIEISAMHQHAEWYLFEGLQRGHKFATVGMADEHCGHPGYDVWPRFGQGGTPRRPFAVRSAITATLAPDLSREGIRDAFFAKRTYATSGDRILLDFAIDDLPMGASGPATAAPEVKVTVHGTAPIDRIDIIRGDRLVHSAKPDALDAELRWIDPAPLRGESWYYVRVVQANGGFAWSTPIWVTSAEGTNDAGDLPRWCDVIWPPPPEDRGPDRQADLAAAARVFGEDPARFTGLVQIGHFTDYRGDYALFRGRDGRDGVPIHLHLYDGFPAPRLYISRGWADFGWVRNGLPSDQLEWSEPTGDWA